MYDGVRMEMEQFVFLSIPHFYRQRICPIFILTYSDNFFLLIVNNNVAYLCAQSSILADAGAAAAATIVHKLRR